MQLITIIQILCQQIREFISELVFILTTYEDWNETLYKIIDKTFIADSKKYF